MTCRNWIAGSSLTFVLGAAALAQDVLPSPSALNRRINCDERGSVFCLDRHTRQNYEGEYVGHDEPSLIFYSDVPGSGNSSIYTVTLPKDPPIAPKQDGTGGTFNFQLHPAFWFGMAVCDTQSAPVPNKNGVCVPNSDNNIADNPIRDRPITLAITLVRRSSSSSFIHRVGSTARGSSSLIDISQR